MAAEPSEKTNVSAPDPPNRFSIAAKVTPATLPAFAPVRSQVASASGPTSVSAPEPPMTFSMLRKPPTSVAVPAARSIVTAVL